MALVMGTAGHIDHGKTSLIRALTGADCDRLAEEKRRGITIELGFAELVLPNGRRLSVVDVPGHERFVRAMAAGASGIDFALLVIAADEGVMPQTREHLDICTLLGIRSGLVALTKTDAVDADMLALAEEDVREFLSGTAFEGAPVLPVSARNGSGLPALLAALETLEASLSPVRPRDLFRMPVDRVFTMRGHGTVLTGTVIGGSLPAGEAVELYPRGLRGRAKAVQSHGENADIAESGRRTAVNVPDFAVADVARGDVLSRPGLLFPCARWAASLSCLPGSPRPLRHRMQVHLHHGARDLQARLHLVGRDALPPGESCLCELRLEEALPAVFGDRFVIRSFSPLRTVGGGLALGPLGVSLRRRSQGLADRRRLLETLDALAADKRPDADRAVERLHAQLLVTEGAERGLDFPRLRVLTALDDAALDKALHALTAARRAVCFDREARLFIADDFFSALEEGCLKALAAFHAASPERQGMGRGELVSGWGRGLGPKLAHAVIERLRKQGKLVVREEFLHLPGHEAAFSESQAPLGQALTELYAKAGLAPPNLKDALHSLGSDPKKAAPVLKALRDAGMLVRVTEDIWYDAALLGGVEAKLRAYFAERESLDLAAFKELTGGLSRKYLVALLEYFDARRVTMRLGEVRVLRRKD